MARKIGFVAQRLSPFLERQSGAGQPYSLAMRRVQIRRYPLSVAEIGDMQPVAQRSGDHGAQTRRLIDLGYDASRRRCSREGSDDLVERMGFALRGQGQEYPGAGGT